MSYSQKENDTIPFEDLSRNTLESNGKIDLVECESPVILPYEKSTILSANQLGVGEQKSYIPVDEAGPLQPGDFIESMKTSQEEEQPKFSNLKSTTEEKKKDIAPNVHALNAKNNGAHCLVSNILSENPGVEELVGSPYFQEEKEATLDERFAYPRKSLTTSSLSTKGIEDFEPTSPGAFGHMEITSDSEFVFIDTMERVECEGFSTVITDLKVGKTSPETERQFKKSTELTLSPSQMERTEKILSECLEASACCVTTNRIELPEDYLGTEKPSSEVPAQVDKLSENDCMFAGESLENIAEYYDCEDGIVVERPVMTVKDFLMLQLTNVQDQAQTGLPGRAEKITKLLSEACEGIEGLLSLRDDTARNDEQKEASNCRYSSESGTLPGAAEVAEILSENLEFFWTFNDLADAISVIHGRIKSYDFELLPTVRYNSIDIKKALLRYTFQRLTRELSEISRSLAKWGAVDYLNIPSQDSECPEELSVEKSPDLGADSEFIPEAENIRNPQQLKEYASTLKQPQDSDKAESAKELLAETGTPMSDHSTPQGSIKSCQVPASATEIACSQMSLPQFSTIASYGTSLAMPLPMTSSAVNASVSADPQTLQDSTNNAIIHKNSLTNQRSNAKAVSSSQLAMRDDGNIRLSNHALLEEHPSIINEFLPYNNTLQRQPNSIIHNGTHAEYLPENRWVRLLPSMAPFQADHAHPYTQYYCLPKDSNGAQSADFSRNYASSMLLSSSTLAGTPNPLQNFSWSGMTTDELVQPTVATQLASTLVIDPHNMMRSGTRNNTQTFSASAQENSRTNNSAVIYRTVPASDSTCLAAGSFIPNGCYQSSKYEIDREHALYPQFLQRFESNAALPAFDSSAMVGSLYPQQSHNMQLVPKGCNETGGYNQFMSASGCGYIPSSAHAPAPTISAARISDKKVQDSRSSVPAFEIERDEGSSLMAAEARDTHTNSATASSGEAVKSTSTLAKLKEQFLATFGIGSRSDGEVGASDDETLKKKQVSPIRQNEGTETPFFDARRKALCKTYTPTATELNPETLGAHKQRDLPCTIMWPPRNSETVESINNMPIPQTAMYNMALCSENAASYPRTANVGKEYILLPPGSCGVTKEYLHTPAFSQPATETTTMLQGACDAKAESVTKHSQTLSGILNSTTKQEAKQEVTKRITVKNLADIPAPIAGQQYIQGMRVLSCGDDLNWQSNIWASNGDPTSSIFAQSMLFPSLRSGEILQDMTTISDGAVQLNAGNMENFASMGSYGGSMLYPRYPPNCPALLENSTAAGGNCTFSQLMGASPMGNTLCENSGASYHQTSLANTSSNGYLLYAPQSIMDGSHTSHVSSPKLHCAPFKQCSTPHHSFDNETCPEADEALRSRRENTGTSLVEKALEMQEKANRNSQGGAEGGYSMKSGHEVNASKQGTAFKGMMNPQRMGLAPNPLFTQGYWNTMNVPQFAMNGRLPMKGAEAQQSGHASIAPADKSRIQDDAARLNELMHTHSLQALANLKNAAILSPRRKNQGMGAEKKGRGKALSSAVCGIGNACHTVGKG